MPLSDDESFIRAIVAAPGDDAPRLVYADWLDERADPRGAFLRAETDAVRTARRFVKDADGERRLQEMAGTLDPVWVARVSRPPLGVACDHLRWDCNGPAPGLPVTETVLSEFERRHRQVGVLSRRLDARPGRPLADPGDCRQLGGVPGRADDDRPGVDTAHHPRRPGRAAAMAGRWRRRGSGGRERLAAAGHRRPV